MNNNIFQPNELVDLYTMLIIFAPAFVEVHKIFTQEQMRLLFQNIMQDQIKANQPLTDKHRSDLLSALNKLKELTKALNCRMTEMEIDRSSEILKNNQCTYRTAAQYWESIENRYMDEIKNQEFIKIDNDKINYCLDPIDFYWGEIKDKYVDMLEDLSESGKCYGFERPTACVFHLMRVMEKALQIFGSKLGINPIDSRNKEKNWQPILNEINKAIQMLDQSDPKTKSYAEASAHLYNVKLAWRNEVMHPKQTYTDEEAKNIMFAVNIFLKDLSEII